MAAAETALFHGGASSPEGNVARLETRIYLGSQLLRDLDVMSMAHGLEVRVPFVDHVLLDAGAASDLPAELLTAHARAVVVPDPSMDSDARSITCDQLRAVGFSEVTMLSKPCQPTDAVERGPRVAA